MSPQAVGKSNADTADFSRHRLKAHTRTPCVIMDFNRNKTALHSRLAVLLLPVIITGETYSFVGKISLDAFAALFLLPLENFKFFFCHSTKNYRVCNPAKLQTIYPVLKVYFS